MSSNDTQAIDLEPVLTPGADEEKRVQDVEIVTTVIHSNTKTTHAFHNCLFRNSGSSPGEIPYTCFNYGQTGGEGTLDNLSALPSCTPRHLRNFGRFPGRICIDFCACWCYNYQALYVLPVLCVYHHRIPYTREICVGSALFDKACGSDVIVVLLSKF